MWGRRKARRDERPSFYICPQRCTAPADEPGACRSCGEPLLPASTGDATHHRRYLLLLRGLLPLLLTVAGGCAAIALLGVAQRAGWLTATPSAGAHSTAAGANHRQRYICPMMCTPPQTEPGRCPVCAMELVAAADKATTGSEPLVEIAPAVRRIANIRTVAVKRATVRRTIRTIGELAFDESRLTTLAAYVDGRLERMYADYTGLTVNAGDRLALIYSPELYSAQVELLESRRSLAQLTAASGSRIRSTQQMLFEGARAKLTELGVTDSQIADLEQRDRADSRVLLFAPMSGTIIEKLAVDGQYVKVGQPIYRLADLTHVWLILELFPEDAAQLRYAMPVTARVQSLPDRTFQGRVAFIDPVVNAQNRTVKVRVDLPNDSGLLRVGDYARAEICVSDQPVGSPVYAPDLAGKWISPRDPEVVRDEPGRCPVCQLPLIPTRQCGYADRPVTSAQTLVVPRSAVLMAGEHSVVYVDTGGGKFEMRPVTLRTVTERQAVIAKGLSEGEQVAVTGNFLIDSQTQLAGLPSLMDPVREQQAKAPTAAPKSGPLDTGPAQIQRLAGAQGERLELLYETYFGIQQALAADQSVASDQATQLADAARFLQRSPDISEQVGTWLKEVGDHGPDLVASSLDDARKAFKPVSRAMLLLATRVRGQAASRPFLHFYCPMVKDGQGDWLQSGKPLANPYWGHKMLRCGKLVQQLDPSADPQPAQVARQQSEGDSATGTAR